MSVWCLCWCVCLHIHLVTEARVKHLVSWTVPWDGVASHCLLANLQVLFCLFLHKTRVLRTYLSMSSFLCWFCESSCLKSICPTHEPPTAPPILSTVLMKMLIKHWVCFVSAKYISRISPHISHLRVVNISLALNDQQILQDWTFKDGKT